MNNPTKLLNTDIIAVEVPRNTKNVTLGSFGFALYFRQKGEIKHINLSFGKVELLGEATEDKLFVDYKKFPEVSLTGEEASLLLDHNDNIDLRKLLQASGLNWANPIEKPECYLVCKTMPFEASADELRRYREWQEAESKLIKGKLIFLKIIK